MRLDLGLACPEELFGYPDPVAGLFPLFYFFSSSAASPLLALAAANSFFLFCSSLSYFALFFSPSKNKDTVVQILKDLSIKMVLKD
jgi:hypothetical protein